MSMETGAPAQTRVTLKDIAERTGLGVSTISLCLNGHRTTGYISQTTRSQVIAAAEELGYQRPRRGRRPRLHHIGILADPSNASWPTVGEICQVLYDRDYRPVMQVAGSHVLRELARDLYERFEIDGAIFVGEPLRAEDLPPPEVPNVVIGGLPEGAEGNLVALDDLAVGRLVGEHLWELGHRTVGVVLVGQCHYPRLREAGLRQVWEEHGAPPSAIRALVEAGWIAAADNVDPRHFTCLIKELVEDSGGDPPTAIFCVTDLWAFWTIQALHRLDRRVPEDLSVVGVDDLPGAASYTPALTTVRQCYRTLGTAAAELLLEVLQDSGQRKVVRQLYEPRLIVRESTAPPPSRSLPACGEGRAGF